MNENFKKSPNGSHECCTLVSLPPIIQQHPELLMITVNYPAFVAIYFLSFLFFSLFLGGGQFLFFYVHKEPEMTIWQIWL